MITYIKGDLFAENHPVIVHGVNCQGVMGSGVAKIIREKYPWAYDAYKDYCGLLDPAYLLGRIKTCWQDNNSPKIVHCFTQLYYGKDGRRYVSYDAVDSCMHSIGMNSLYTKPKFYIAMPKIGAGLGGGEWPIIEYIINYRLKDIDVRVYEL